MRPRGRGRGGGCCGRSTQSFRRMTGRRRTRPRIRLGTRMAASFWLYLAACCLASGVFTNLVYTLTKRDESNTREHGKCCAGGLMPVQMLSAPLFQEIYPWLPFAHSMPALEGAMAVVRAAWRAGETVTLMRATMEMAPIHRAREV